MSYAEAKARYAAIGVDTEAAIARLKTVPISLHCWQGDDVRGFDTDPTKPLTGGIQTTGNYPGRARTPEELMADMDKVLSLCPGTKKINLHASYAIFDEEKPWVDRDKLEPKHFKKWVDTRKTRHIETRPQISHYTVETSVNGADWTICETVARECSNGYFEFADGIRARYVRVTGGELPYGQTLRISGLRVFGNGEGAKPAQAEAAGIRVDALDAKISWQHIENAQGCNVRYGVAPDKLYLSWLVYDADEVALSTLTAGQEYYICVDSFNENGITPGKTFKLEG